jgi:polysaccharide export outer membrane protein
MFSCLGCAGSKIAGEPDPNQAAREQFEKIRQLNMIVPGDRVELHYYKNYQSDNSKFRFDIGDRLQVSLRAGGEKSRLEKDSNSYIIKNGDTLMISYYKRYLSGTEEYRLDIGDRLLITVHTHPKYSKEVVILPDGTISVLKVGVLKAKGLTVLELDKLLTNGYKKELISPDIDVFVLEAESKLNGFLDRIFTNLDKTEGKLSVGFDGTVDLPLVGTIKISEATLSEAKRIINEKYQEAHYGLEVTLNLVSGDNALSMPGNQTVSRDVVVLPDGTISLAKIGQIKVKGLTVAELNDKLTDEYRKKYINPEVEIVVGNVQEKLNEFFNLLSQNYGSRSKVFLVDMAGNLNLPIVGDVGIAGKTIAEASEIVTEKYRAEYPAMEVNLAINQSVRVTVAVMGEVNKPGVYQLTGRVSPLYALALAGGEMDTADLSNILIMRGTQENPEKIFVDMDDDASWVRKSDIYVQAGDIVYVFKTGIASVDTFVDQYIRKLLPFNLGAGVYYDLNKR